MKISNKEKQIIYAPWSEEVLEFCIQEFEKNKVPALDIELSAACSHGSCIYCDSQVGVPHQNEMEINEIRNIIEQGRRMGLKWVYICGLGEPTNDPKFRHTISLFHQHGINISMFTSGIGYSRDDVSFLKDCNVSIILKMDSFDSEVFDYLLGKKGAAKSIYRTKDYLLDAGYGQKAGDFKTNIAFSIVPTNKNVQDIPEIVRYCQDYNIFPSIGELEYSGKAKDIHNNLTVPKSKLLELKREIEEILGYPYERPICPASIAGIHINNIGKYVVHKTTGLSCQWFLLCEPEYYNLGDVRTDDLSQLNKKIRMYRRQQLKNVFSLLKDSSEWIFGGCGGQPKEILSRYLKLYRKEEIKCLE